VHASARSASHVEQRLHAVGAEAGTAEHGARASTSGVLVSSANPTLSQFPISIKMKTKPNKSARKPTHLQIAVQDARGVDALEAAQDLVDEVLDVVVGKRLL
jgi:hypothetical protein